MFWGDAELSAMIGPTHTVKANDASRPARDTAEEVRVSSELLFGAACGYLVRKR